MKTKAGKDVSNEESLFMAGRLLTGAAIMEESMGIFSENEE